MASYRADNWMLAWVAADAVVGNFPGEKPQGSVEVGIHPDKKDWSGGYDSTVGCCFADWHDLDRNQQVEKIYRWFHELVVADGIDPQKLHTELLKIDFYRQSLLPEIPGAEPLIDRESDAA